jgi:hypothetical protein
VRRRIFLATLATAPLWIRRAFGDNTTKLPTVAVDLDGARAHARSVNRPLLVLVIPAGVDRQARGQAWGTYLTHAEPADFNLLSLAEVVCAPMADVRRVAPEISDEPWAVLVEGDRARAFAGTVPPRTVLANRRDDQSAIGKSIDREIAAIAKLLRDGFKPDAATLARLSKGLDKELAHRLRQDAPPGSRWDKVWDCPPCGMAYIAPKSERFLSFYVRGEPPPPKPFGSGD